MPFFFLAMFSGSPVPHPDGDQGKLINVDDLVTLCQKVKTPKLCQKGIKSHQCDICGTFYRNKDSLKYHRICAHFPEQVKAFLSFSVCLSVCMYVCIYVHYRLENYPTNLHKNSGEVRILSQEKCRLIKFNRGDLIASEITVCNYHVGTAKIKLANC